EKQMINPICQALGIKHPILLGGLLNIGTAPLAAAVSAAGGFGILAAGGIGDGRGLAAALALGAVGVQMGTVFLGTAEAQVGRAYKEALIMAGLVREIVPARAIVASMVREARDIFGPGNDRLGLIESK
ncbi:MAG: nitronate monooxygenase, partial [Deltaproteobacteria bacterium]|nr:nitronate monooxygenase [Deltaproteobacteria bacterium]